MASVNRLAQMLAATKAVFESQRPLLSDEQHRRMVDGHRTSFIQQIDRLAHLDMQGSVELNAALEASGFDGDAKAAVAATIAQKSLESVLL